MTWIVWLGSVALMLMLLASIPIHVEFSVTSTPWAGHVRMCWGGVMRVERGFGQAQDAGSRATRTATARRKGAPRRPGRAQRPPWSVVIDLFRHGMSFARQLLRQTQLGPMQLTLRLGCEDPADTGIMYGVLSPLVPLVDRPQCSVQLDCCFWESCFELQGHGRVTVVPIRYIAVTAAFLLSPRTWRLAFDLARAQ